ncbi:HAD domain-containing protein [Acidovorax sp. Be4]|uniref:HAD domain-containing protein n=1 Tax=Acidovorax bellezanensis TaxID=2976702 RepID=A0ABT2PLK3_9BURK|nr:HAD domain-containing protein [Acidovorax sp. Be4]MCT9811356.1 HAD domain-containing protein [Acidovorax sp. Be4]
MSLVLFLDFDGVLHPLHCHESRHFSNLELFEQSVRSINDLQIVVSSTWRLSRSLEQLRERFSQDVAKRIVGCCPPFRSLSDVPPSLVGYEREAECRAWLRANAAPWTLWLAVDDSPWLFRPFSKNLLVLNKRTGLDAAACVELRRRLNGVSP